MYGEASVSHLPFPLVSLEDPLCMKPLRRRSGLDLRVPSQPRVPAEQATCGKVCLCLNTKLSVTLVVSGDKTDTRRISGCSSFSSRKQLHKTNCSSWQPGLHNITAISYAEVL